MSTARIDTMPDEVFPLLQQLPGMPMRRQFLELHPKDQTIKLNRRARIESNWSCKVQDCLPLHLRPRVELKKGAKARVGDVGVSEEIWWNWSVELLRGLEELSTLTATKIEFAQELLHLEVTSRQQNPKHPQRRICEALLGDVQRVLDGMKRSNILHKAAQNGYRAITTNKEADDDDRAEAESETQYDEGEYYEDEEQGTYHGDLDDEDEMLQDDEEQEEFYYDDGEELGDGDENEEEEEDGTTHNDYMASQSAQARQSNRSGKMAVQRHPGTIARRERRTVEARRIHGKALAKASPFATTIAPRDRIAEIRNRLDHIEDMLEQANADSQELEDDIDDSEQF